MNIEHPRHVAIHLQAIATLARCECEGKSCVEWCRTCAIKSHVDSLREALGIECPEPPVDRFETQIQYTPGKRF